MKHLIDEIKDKKGGEEGTVKFWSEAIQNTKMDFDREAKALSSIGVGLSLSKEIKKSFVEAKKCQEMFLVVWNALVELNMCKMLHRNYYESCLTCFKNSLNKKKKEQIKLLGNLKESCLLRSKEDAAYF